MCETLILIFKRELNHKINIENRNTNSQYRTSNLIINFALYIIGCKFLQLYVRVIRLQNLGYRKIQFCNIYVTRKFDTVFLKSPVPGLSFVRTHGNYENFITKKANKIYLANEYHAWVWFRIIPGIYKASQVVYKKPR